MTAGYHDSRFVEDPRRALLWKSLWRFYFSREIAPEHTVLDLGCGYGSFINTVVAQRRIALDNWPGFPRHLLPGIEPVVASVTELGFLEPGTVDFAFASNIFEHISKDNLAEVLEGLRRALRASGTLTIVQPNYRYAFREYFDDYTHQSVYSHVSMTDFLVAHGYEVLEVRPRFLPLTIKSGMPVSPLLIRAYLASPLKPLGKQMLLKARPCR